MQTFKKILLSAIVFITVFAVLSGVFLHSYYYSDNYYYMDRAAREEYEGTIDTLFCGSSHGLCAFSPQVIDPQLDCSSYNICGSMMTLNGTCAITEQELSKNPVRTVYIEVCYSTLTRDRSLENDEGEIYLIPRLDSAADRFGYYLKWADHKNYENLYSQIMVKAFNAEINSIKGDNMHYGALNSGFKGFYPQYSYSDLSIPDDSVEKLRDSVQYPAEPIEENLRQLDRLVDMCEDHDAKIVFVVTPISESMLWRAANMDDVMQVYSDYCDAHGYEYLDFNLLKDRRELFPDSHAFSDNLHLYYENAEFFSTRFAEVISSVNNNEPIDDMFFDSYSRMKEEMPYSGTLQNP